MASEIFFVTSSDEKYEEMREIIPNIGRLSLDLPEIQSLETKEIVNEKLRIAAELGYNNIFVDDTALHIDSLSGLPGPLAKWFVAALGTDKLSKLAQGSKATALTIIGCRLANDEIVVQGVTEGSIVPPRGKLGFGWDAVFQPEGSEFTFAEMEAAEKKDFSMRVKAALAFRAVLKAKNLI
jgi:inosine triphosphate pyrophosphatase